METKDILYDKRNEIGIRDDVTDDELIKLINIVMVEENISETLKKDVAKLVEMSMKMRSLLQECRGIKLPISIAKKIDEVLKEIEYL